MGGEAGDMIPPLFLKLYFVWDVILKIHLCVILQGIQNFFGPGTPKFCRGPSMPIMSKFKID